MLQLLLAAVAATAPAPGESPVREPECRITDFGVQGDSRLIGVRPELGTASGRVMLNEDAPMAEHTDTIPAKLGLSFGIKHDFLGIPEGEPIELTLTYPRMKMLSGATRSMSTSLFDPAVTAGTSFTFEIKEELVPGTWTFKFHHRWQTAVRKVVRSCAGVSSETAR